MTAEDIEIRIRTFLAEELLVDIDENVDRATNLFQAGVIESRDYLQVLRFIQHDLGAPMTDEELFTGVLVSLEVMVDFVQRKHLSQPGTR